MFFHFIETGEEYMEYGRNQKKIEWQYVALCIWEWIVGGYSVVPPPQRVGLGGNVALMM